MHVGVASGFTSEGSVVILVTLGTQVFEMTIEAAETLGSAILRESGVGEYRQKFYDEYMKTMEAPHPKGNA